MVIINYYFRKSWLFSGTTCLAEDFFVSLVFERHGFMEKNLLFLATPKFIHMAWINLAVLNLSDKNG
tara:strand:- start:1100 stop:1300 length:201 start_codon:yes stop_codon:yes gene_type:complete